MDKCFGCYPENIAHIIERDEQGILACFENEVIYLCDEHAAEWESFGVWCNRESDGAIMNWGLKTK